MGLVERFKRINKNKQLKFNKMTKEDVDNKKSELVNDLMATITIMEDYWRFHPDNKNAQDVKVEYTKLQEMKKEIEGELAELDKE